MFLSIVGGSLLLLVPLAVHVEVVEEVGVLARHALVLTDLS